jgi:hypothetical protein
MSALSYDKFLKFKREGKYRDLNFLLKRVAEYTKELENLKAKLELPDDREKYELEENLIDEEYKEFLENAEHIKTLRHLSDLISKVEFIQDILSANEDILLCNT